MNYLLDTHVFLWAIFDAQKLSEAAKGIILEPLNSIYISLITFWEISLKYAVGKIDLENISPEALPMVSKEAGFETLQLTEADVSTFHNLPLIHHRDPFDRLIIWQAINNDMILVSKDKQLKDYEKSGFVITW